RRALRAVLREAPPGAAPRDLLVVKIVFLVVVVVVIVIIVVVIVGLRLEGGDQIGHFDGRTGAITALFGGAGFGLLFVFSGEHTIGHGNARFQRDTADCRCAFVADDLEVVGFAANHGTQRDQGV